MTNVLLYYLIVINVVTFLVYGIDKWRSTSGRLLPTGRKKAKQGSWRISEATLLVLAIIGGSIGALLGMKVWHREYCLSLGADVEEKLPFQKFFAKQSGKAERKSGEGVLVFYVMGHMFSFFDCNDFSVISLKCQPERIEDSKAQHDCIGNPYNESPKHWIGINPNSAPDDLLQELTRNSFEIVKAKYTKK